MIHILYGEDILSSYNRLQQILKNYESYQKIKLDDKSSVDNFFVEISTDNLFNFKKVIICENFLHFKKIKVDELNKIPKDQDVIFWEKSKLTPAIVSKIARKYSVYEFKLKPQLYYFLDSISANWQNTLRQLYLLNKSKPAGLNWHLAERLEVLILAKLNVSRSKSEEIIGRSIQDWQWKKISSQARSLDLAALEKLFSGTITIDYLTKSGKTNLDEVSMLSTLFLKYLSS